MVHAQLPRPLAANTAAPLIPPLPACPLQEEQRLWEERVAEGRGQLRAARAAAQALERQVAKLQAQLRGEQACRAAAEEQLQRQQAELQELRRWQQEAAQQAAKERQQQRRREHEQDARAAAAPAPAKEQAVDARSAAPPAVHPGGQAPGAATEAVLMHHMLQLHQEVAALKVGAQPPQRTEAAQAAAPEPAPTRQAWQGWVEAAPQQAAPQAVPVPPQYQQQAPMPPPASQAVPPSGYSSFSHARR